MSQTRSEQMVNRLRSMQAAAPDIEASAIVSVDGLIMASALPADVEEDRVSAMSAAMLSLGERIAGELGRGGLEQVYIKGNAGFIVLDFRWYRGSTNHPGPPGGQAWSYLSRNAPGRRGPGQVGRMKPTKKKQHSSSNVNPRGEDATQWPSPRPLFFLIIRSLALQDMCLKGGKG